MTTMPSAPLHLVMTPHVEFIRVYDQPDGYEKRLPYIGIMAVTHLSPGVIWVHGAHIDSAVAKVNRQLHAQVLDMLRTRGITTLLVERHGKMKPIELQEAAHEQPEYQHPRTA